MRISRTKILPGLIVMWVLAFAVYYGMPPLEDMLLQGDHLLFDYMTWQNGAAENWGYRLLWVIGDLSEGTVHKSLFASVGVVLGGWIAHTLWKKGSGQMGCPICAGTGLFPWVVFASFLGLLVSSALYAGNLANGWVPTFLPGCTIPAPLPPTVSDSPFWIIRRSLADFTEIYFYGNEIAGLCLVAGMLLSWALNPAHAGYGGPYFTSAILAAQLMGSSLAIFLNFGSWQKYGWYNTFTASLAQGAMVLTFGTDLKVLLISAVLSAVITPFCAFKASGLVPKRFHAVVGGTCGMGVGIAIEGVIIKALLTVL